MLLKQNTGLFKLQPLAAGVQLLRIAVAEVGQEVGFPAVFRKQNFNKWGQVQLPLMLQ